jgi:hypothetical protein
MLPIALRCLTITLWVVANRRVGDAAAGSTGVGSYGLRGHTVWRPLRSDWRLLRTGRLDKRRRLGWHFVSVGFGDVGVKRGPFILIALSLLMLLALGQINGGEPFVQQGRNKIGVIVGTKLASL